MQQLVRLTLQVGINLWGILYGKMFSHHRDNEKTFRYFLFTGVTFWCFFLLVRLLGVSGAFWFGNFRLPPHHNGHEFAAAMFSLSKYPPSIAYVTLFLGLDMLLAFAIHKTRFHAFAIATPANVFGKVSLFFYVTHLWLYLLLGWAFSRTRYGLPIYYAYPLWACGLAFLYPLCVRFGEFKARQSYDSIWKLF